MCRRTTSRKLNVQLHSYLFILPAARTANSVHSIRHSSRQSSWSRGVGCLIHCSGSSEPEIKRRANIVREAISLDQNIWRSSITLETKLCLYNTCIAHLWLSVPVLPFPFFFIARSVKPTVARLCHGKLSVRLWRRRTVMTCVGILRKWF